VEHNPAVAAEWLILLSSLSAADENADTVNGDEKEGPIEQHLALLLLMEKNLKSVEVVNRLCCSTTIALPVDFLQSYITSCIAGCSDITDVYLQTRRVRLVCAFLLSLLRQPSAMISMKSYIVEIQTFCIEFARVKEASTLYRMLKSPTTEQLP